MASESVPMGELAEGAAGLTLSDASMACFRMFNSYPWMHDREFFASTMPPPHMGQP